MSDVHTSEPRAPATTPDTKALIRTIVGTGIGLATLLLMLIGLMFQQNANVNARIDDVNANVNARFDDVNRRIDDIQDDFRELRAEVRAEIRELQRLVTEALQRPDPAD